MKEPDTNFSGNLLGRLTSAQKFGIISLLFIISLSVALYFMLQAQNKAIQFSENELRGVHFVRSIRKLLESVPEHSLLVNRNLTGDDTVNNDLRNVQNTIQTSLKHLNAIDNDFHENIANYFDGEQFREISGNLRATEIEKRWQEITRRFNTMTPESSLKIHRQFLNELLELLNYVGQTSNQFLDQDINVYFLLAPSLDPLPRAWIAASETILLSQSMLREKEPSAELRDELIGQLALYKYFNDEAQRALDNFLPRSNASSISQDIAFKLREPYKQFSESSEEFISFVEKNIMQTPETTMQAQLLLLGSKAINADLALWDAIYDQAEKQILERVHRLRMQEYVWVGVTLITAFIALFLGYIILRQITTPVRRLVNAAKQMVAGDLSVRVPITGNDEIGQVSSAFNSIAESFQDLIGRLQWTGIQLTSSSTEIAAAAKQQETTIVEQEATTKEIAVTAREISSTAKEFAKTMNDISNTAEQTSALASSGKAGLNRMESIMHQMVDASASISSKLGILSEKAGNITNVITTINKVAEQTNLLSLNAAIEAEKAGEHGRSFSVIAREIRRLADQTANATLDIEKIINEIVSAVSAGVMGVDKFSEEIHSGVSQVSMVSEQLSKIIEQVQMLSTNFENVNQGMQAQSIGAEQINESITQLSDAAQQTTESIRQFNNAIEQLNHVALEMQNAVSKIKR